MVVKMSELRCKEVICVEDGRRLGYVSDVQVKVPEGCILALIVPGPCRVLGPLIFLKVCYRIFNRCNYHIK